jgi:hypothetical protein
MPALSRRAFLGWLAATVPAAAIVRRAHAAAVAHLEADPRLLRALADAVLPASLGEAGIRCATDAFRQWIDEYREGAELNHGYGTSALRFTRSTPATRWSAQLDAMNVRALEKHGRRFDATSRADRVVLVREALDKERIDRMPAVADAGHVAAALVAHFFDSAEAVDLCYEAQIGKNTCRPLASSARRPLPLARTR